MNFIAQEILAKPLLAWQSTNEPTSNPLVKAQEDIPATAYGVYPLKIVAGALVDRTLEEMNVFKDENDYAIAVSEQREKIDIVENSTFIYLTKEYPMNEVARLHYAAMQSLGVDTDVMNTTGLTDEILAADIPAFMTAYFTQLKTITQP